MPSSSKGVIDDYYPYRLISVEGNYYIEQRKQLGTQMVWVTIAGPEYTLPAILVQ